MSKLKQKPKTYRFRKIVATILVLILVVGLIGTGFMLNKIKGMVDTRPALDIQKLNTPDSTIVFDADGNKIAEIAQKYNDNISYSDLPTAVIDAFVSVEDAKFFEHDGFDLSRFVLSALQGIPKMLSGRGFGAGASTITMQTIKNGIFASDEKLADVSIERKVQEISLALDLEKKIDKKKILELYVNHINYGAPNSRGIQKAAEYYFGKSVSQLNLSEAAYLAGVVNGPNLYNAYNNLEEGTARRNIVLDLMVRHGYITADEANVAKSIPLENLLIGEEKYITEVSAHQAYLDVVIDELYNVYQLDPYTQGLKVYTALNTSQQEMIESIEANNYDIYYDDLIDSAFVTLNNQTGEIVAIGGGRDLPNKEKVQRGFNNAFSLYRQPGSSMKPILPYALAFEYLGYSTKHVFEDGPYVYPGTDIFVNNASRQYSGDVLFTEAISHSLNIPALKTYDAVNSVISHDGIVEFLKNIGFDKYVDDVSSSAAIGGGMFEATPLQVAAAHATMINGGEYIQPHTIRKVEVNGQVIEANPKKVQAISKGAAYLSTELMYDAVHNDRWYGTSAHYLTTDYPVYGKSGTSDFGDEFEQYGIPEGTQKDSWLVGSTSEYTNIAWNGYVKFVNEDGTGNYASDINLINKTISSQVNLLLDNSTNFHEPAYLEEPDDVSSITHVLAMYPYVAPVENMSSDYIVTGKILSKYASLGAFSTGELTVETLKSQEVKVGEFLLSGLNIDVNVAPYPDSEALGNGSKSKILSATSASGRTVSITARKLFDPAWVFGTINYVTEIKADGSVIDRNKSDSNSKHFVLLNTKSNQALDVCSYYTYSNNEKLKSNEVCETIKTPELEINFPTLVGQSRDVAVNWLNSNGISNITLDYATPKSNYDIDKVAATNPDVNGQKVNIDKIRESGITLTIYDAQVTNLDKYIGYKVSDLIANNPYPGVLIIKGNTSNNNAIITDITANGATIPSSFSLSEINTITFTAE